MVNLKYPAFTSVLNFCSFRGQRCIDLVVVFASLYQHSLLTLVLVTWNRTLCVSSVDTTYIYLHWCAAAALPRLFAYRSVICHTNFLAVACVRNHLFCIMGSYYTKLRSDVLALQHARQLCECPTDQQRLLYRHSLAELDDLLCKEKENTVDSKVREILLPYLSLLNAVCFMLVLALMSLCVNSFGQCSLVWGVQGICNFGPFNSLCRNIFISCRSLLKGILDRFSWACTSGLACVLLN